MSYLGTALQRRLERQHLNQTDIAKLSGISRSYISRLLSGEFQELSDANFSSLLKAFATNPRAQAELIAARCLDARAGVATTPGAALVEVRIRDNSPAQSQTPAASASPAPAAFPAVELSHETEKAFAWLRCQCPVNPELEKHLVGYAKMLGMK